MSAASIRPLIADRGGRFDLSLHHLDSNREPHDHEASVVSLVVLERSAIDDVISTHDGSGTDDGWINVVVEGDDTAEWPSGKKAYRLVVDGEFMLIGPLSIRTAADV